MDPLPDPYGDRKIKEVEAPPMLPLSNDLMWNSSDIPDYELIMSHIKKEGKISKDNMMKLTNYTLDIMKKEPSLVYMSEPIWLVGDIHGQFYDLVHMLEKAGKPSKINYLFLGDYVDRGIFSVEVMILLFALKINFPESIVLLRGNHECRNMTQHFTFREETLTKYDEEVYNLIMEVFDAMPLAAIVNKKYFAVHGGISPDLKKIEMIENIDRFKEPPTEGMFWDLLWSDPLDDSLATDYDYKENEEREWSYLFGKKPVKKLLEKNDLMSVVRAHQVQVDGYKMHRWDGESSFPYVITIFSAPNYWDYYSNKAAVLILKDEKISIKQYDQSDHPYYLPDQIDIFTWSMPFLADKVVAILSHLLKIAGGEDMVDEDLETDAIDQVMEASEKAKKVGVIKSKVKSVARMHKMLHVLKDEQETLLKIKTMAPDGKIPRGLLLEGRPAIRDTFREFKNAQKLDKNNEKMPHFK